MGGPVFHYPLVQKDVNHIVTTTTYYYEFGQIIKGKMSDIHFVNRTYEFGGKLVIIIPICVEIILI